MLQQRFDVVLCSVTGDNGALCGGGIIPDDGDVDVKTAFCRWLVPRVSSSSRSHTSNYDDGQQQW